MCGNESRDWISVADKGKTPTVMPGGGRFCLF